MKVAGFPGDGRLCYVIITYFAGRPLAPGLLIIYPEMKIVLIDSQLVFTQALKIALENSQPGLEVVETYPSTGHFMANFTADTPTVVITELGVNGRYDQGTESIFRLAQAGIKLIVLTSLDQHWLIRQYMKLGAKAFLSKSCSLDELLAAISQVEKGKLFLSDEIQEALWKGIRSGQPLMDDLTSIELAILEGLSRGVPLRTVADGLNISMIELKYHRRMLMVRFNTRHIADMIDLANRLGVIKTQAPGNQPGRPEKPAIKRGRNKRSDTDGE